MTIPEAFQAAVQHYQAGRPAEADALCRRILAVQPTHADVLNLLGVIAKQAGRYDAAVDFMRRAIAANPAEAHFHLNLGNTHFAQNHLDEAIAEYQRALQMRPDWAEAHNNLGNALRERGQFGEAISACRQAVRIKPDFPQAHNNLGNALRDRGELDEAIAAYRRAILVNGNIPEVYNNLGNALRDRGRLDEAIAACRRALELRPGYPEAHVHLGAALCDLGWRDEGMAEYHRALALKPDDAPAYINLGNALWDREQLDEAVGAYRRALESKPDSMEAFHNLGNALKDGGKLDEAIAAYRRALEIKPDCVSAQSNLIYALHFHPGHDNKTIAEEHQRWNRQFGEPLRKFVTPHANDRRPGRRLKVGYVSPDFYDQAEAYFVVPLFEGHDHRLFEIHAYASIRRPDAITERLKRSVDVWHDTRGVSDAALAERIRQDGIDVLVDLTMHMRENRMPLFCRQPAPVQVSWLAYPGSTGLEGMGYRLTDAHMEPPGEDASWSSEEPVRLPDSWCCYLPLGDSPEVGALPALSTGRITFGSLNSFCKMHAGVLARWARLLEAVKGSRLVMRCPEGSARERIRTFFGTHGIEEERVEFVGRLPRFDYLQVYQRIDLGLDPFPYNGITTTCDALWMGVPVLTLPGATPASRASMSLLASAGVEGFVARSEEEHIEIANRLAGDLPRLAEVRAGLRARMKASRLMDGRRFAGNVEATYRMMWERFVGGGG